MMAIETYKTGSEWAKDLGTPADTITESQFSEMDSNAFGADAGDLTQAEKLWRSWTP